MITPTILNVLLDRVENTEGYAEEGQAGGQQWVGCPERLERELLCGPFVHLTSHLGNAVSCLMQAQEDYIWRGIRFLKTKGCAFRSLTIPPLRFFSSRVANVFTGDAVRVFLISSPPSLGDFLCVMVRTV